ncbi:MAG: acyltransferase [Candidatus Dormibacterales bacterium]
MVPRAKSERAAGEWIDELDLLRALALLAVVVIHAGSWVVGGAGRPQAGPIDALVAVARFCVPAFVLMSGIVLQRAYGGRPRRPALFLRRRWLRVLVPWLVWTPVFYALAVATGGLPAAPGALLRWAALGAGHLYFLVLIAQLYLVMLVMPRGRRGLAAFAAAAVAAQLALGWLHTYLLASHVRGLLAWPLVYDAQLEAPFWIGYFGLGCLIGAEYERLRRLSRYWWAALGAAVLAVVVMLEVSAQVPGGTFTQSTYSYLWPSMAPMTLAIAATVLWAGRRLRPHLGPVWPAVRGLSRHSLGVYVLHVIVIVALGTATAGILTPARYVLLVIAALALTYPVVALLAATRLGALALGEDPARAHREAGRRPANRRAAGRRPAM